jgi:hypothetical protein
MNFFRESRRGLTSRTGLCSSRRQQMGAIPSEIGIAELLEEHGLSGILRTSCAISEARPVMRLAEIAEYGRGFKIRGYTQDHISLTGIAPRLAPPSDSANKRRLEDLLGRDVCGFAYLEGARTYGTSLSEDCL